MARRGDAAHASTAEQEPFSSQAGEVFILLLFLKAMASHSVSGFPVQSTTRRFCRRW